MKPGQDAGEHFLWVSLLRDQVENVGEPTTGRNGGDIIVPKTGRRLRVQQTHDVPGPLT